MCGLAGFWSTRLDDATAVQTLRGMTDALVHRGRDDAGAWCDPDTGIALGHRRLSIVDLSPLGHQPMASHRDRFRIGDCGLVRRPGRDRPHAWTVRRKSRRSVRSAALPDLERRLAEKMKSSVRKGNTTLTLVVTNLKLSAEELTQVARQVHASMARAIQPFATMDDGDVLFAMTTDEVEGMGITSLGMIASEVAWDAILSIYRSSQLDMPMQT